MVIVTASVTAVVVDDMVADVVVDTVSSRVLGQKSLGQNRLTLYVQNQQCNSGFSGYTENTSPNHRYNVPMCGSKNLSEKVAAVMLIVMASVTAVLVDDMVAEVVVDTISSSC